MRQQATSLWASSVFARSLSNLLYTSPSHVMRSDIISMCAFSRLMHMFISTQQKGEGFFNLAKAISVAAE